MSSLADTDKSRARYHLGYNETVPFGDRALLEVRMTKIADSYTVGKIGDRLDRCDRTLAETESDEQSSGVASKRLLLGDVNRTDIEYRTETLKTRWKVYYDETDALAREIGAMNWRKPEMDQYRCYSETIQNPTVPAPVEIVYNLTYGTDLYLYFA
jgi:hypothetical protein